MSRVPEDINSGLVATSAAAAAIAILTRLGFIDVQRASAQFLTIKLLDGFLALFLGRHFNEAETS